MKTFDRFNQLWHPHEGKSPSIRCRLARAAGRLLVWSVLLALVFLPFSASACSACFGETGSPMSKALSWGVLALFGIVLSVLGAFVAFAVYMARRAAAVNAQANAAQLQLDEDEDSGGVPELEPAGMPR